MNYIVDFIDDITEAQLDKWMLDNEVTKHTLIDSRSSVYLVETTKTPATSDLVEAITEDINISSQLLGTVEVIPLSTGTSASFDHDGDWWKTVSCLAIDFTADETTFEHRGAMTNVYLLDSGVLSTHPELVDAKIENVFSLNAEYTDTSGHGTALASLIVGKTCGITNSTLKNVKIFEKQQDTMLSDLVKAFDAILVDIVANPNSIAVVNMSWSIAKNEYVESKIQRLIDVGAIVIAAAGNSGLPIENVTPASMANVLTVGAFDQDFKPADFSDYTSDITNTPDATNHGELDVWAPGVAIKAALLDGTVGNISGTSAAAAIMAACAAYNSDMSYTNEGPATKAAILIGIQSKMKHDLLVLSEKYASSVNRCATFIPHAISNFEYGTFTITNLIYANVPNSVFIAHNTLVSKIELSIDLPAGLTLSNGWIVGQLETPPTTGTEELNFIASITYLSGVVNDYNVKLFLLTPDLAYGDKPTDVKLQLYCEGSGASGCSGLCEAACEACDKFASCQPCGNMC